MGIEASGDRGARRLSFAAKVNRLSDAAYGGQVGATSNLVSPSIKSNSQFPLLLVFCNIEICCDT